jgi:hypothetical protein
MSYTINKTDGSILATVADGQIDQLSSDLTLIGKNYSGFGDALNENFVKLLENFSNTAQPTNPIRGQIWFDVAELKLKVYTGSSFQPVSSATIASTQPLTLGVGDLWFNDIDRQLYFYDGTTTILLGPSYSTSQLLSGLQVVNLLDTNNFTRVVTYLYTNGVLLGIFSKDTFTPKLPITGFTTGTTILPGFNAGSLAGIKFNVTASNSDSLGNQPAASYLRRDIDNIINGQLTVTSNRGVLIGDTQQAQILVQDGNVQILNDQENKNIVVKVKRGASIDEVFFVNTVNQQLGIYENNPNSLTTIGGDLTIIGNLTVEGDTTTVNTSVLVIEDKNIVLGSLGDNPSTDENADGGGIILKGLTDHQFLWSNANDAWESNSHLLLDYGYKIYIKDEAGIPNEVLSLSALGGSVTSIPGVTSFGTQTRLTIGPVLIPGEDPEPYVEILDNRISTLVTNQNLEIAPNGAGNIVLIGSPKITGLADPTLAQDAATKEYVDITAQSRNLVFSMDISDAISNTGIAAFITLLAPPSEYRNSTLARVLCTSLSNNSTSLNINSYLNTSTTEFITPDAPSSIVPGGTGFGISNVTFGTATISPQVVSVFRVVKTFQLQSGVWTFVS